jgi:uncharacterized repeat protein (TIGR02543 family)
MSFSLSVSRKLVSLGVALLGLAAATQAQTNLALNKATTCSASPKQASSLAVDGNTATRWESAYSDPQWIYVDLGASTTINQVTLVWEAANAKNYTVDVSNDKTTWTTVATKTNMANSARTDNVTFNAVTYRYVRMNGTARNLTYGYSIWEFRVFNTGVTTYTLSTTVSPSGSGTVSLSPAGGSYASGTSVTVTASPGAGYVFSKWSGASTSTSNPVTITMPASNTSITATFTASPTKYTLSTTVAPSGSGTVTLSPTGGSYTSGTSVTVTATPGAGYVFSKWSGASTSTGNPVTITMPANNTSVTATFTAMPGAGGWVTGNDANDVALPADGAHAIIGSLTPNNPEGSMTLAFDAMTVMSAIGEASYGVGGFTCHNNAQSRTISLNPSGLDVMDGPNNTQMYAGFIYVSGSIQTPLVLTDKVTIKNWSIEAPDFVFDKSYKLRPLSEVESYITENKHLPEMPSSSEMKAKGVDLSVLNMDLLKKVEELTLYVIEQNKKIEKMQKEIAEKK